MNCDPCPEMEEMLVDFADNALASDEAARVREHIEQCPDCRATVAALRQSLVAAQTIWQSNLPHMHSHHGRTLQSRKWRYVAAAAGITLMAGTLFYRPARHQPAPSVPTLVEIENRIAESSRAARLLARVNKLESQASLRAIAESQYQYIVEKYPNTAAAESVHRKLESYRQGE